MSSEDIVLILQRGADEFVAYHRQMAQLEDATPSVDKLVGSNPPPFLVKPTLQSVVDEVEKMEPYPEFGYEFVDMETVVLTREQYDEMAYKVLTYDALVGMSEEIENSCGA